MKHIMPSLLIASCFVLGGFLFKTSVSYDCSSISSKDYIFVLTGDYRRIPFAMRQLKKHPDVNLYIIGAGAENFYKPTKKIQVESESKSTYQNAKAIRNIIKRKNIKKIVVITTEDHIQRAKYLIHQEVPDINIISCPVPLYGMSTTKRLERWTIEYIKYIVTILGIKEGHIRGEKL